MADEQDRATVLGDVLHFPDAFLLKLRVADSQHLIDDQDLRFQMRRDSKCQANIHAAGVAFHWSVDELVYFSESHDIVEFPANLGAVHSEDGTVEKNVFAARQLGMEACADFQ